jgi:hypothetical protein
MNKISIKLTPYEILSILAFMREHINENNKNVRQMRSIHEVVESFEKEAINKLTDEDIDFAVFERYMNDFLGKEPPVRR